ncbi:sulfite exporter TauE/SafE family protein [Arthrobacter sp. zg-Y820]|uniref:sulfite exporter TauE/SafE family protein n=1 Tax=unclassified Arthrobacter TaxID=235627 RepID=UPI001E3E22AE|nr:MULTISPECIES: sulfite exporter TauE/SafE family protein [unclassified Arthrobacter]MCC9196646.1 sulfite exporter TauE/SafE family protein [Arthrobacter sp. zg-Y820]MDK1279508.1 sulfite exporter TauE/SafE family protein [Arthrobacter sp. zg.Y820]MDK1358873.1 sulfite exporter TauE/SafE family protein [Arthrobacter sp. zg-Y1219]WIB08115.1 sulfite exporter TauE/SafE family protein [Arthrobacter sp. zg-Y820]
MDLFHSALVFFAGLWAGTINAVVGSGTLVTFPVLVALGYAPVAATISNAMGLIAGNLAGSWGYRRELAGLKSTLLKLLPASILGGITGAALLLHLPESVFSAVAPYLIVVALLFVIFQPALQRWVRRRAEASAPEPQSGGSTLSAAPKAPRRQTVILIILIYLAGVYGGYFVAAQGILLVGILGIFLHGSIQNANAMKNILVLGVNIVAAVSYLLFAFDRIVWPVVALIAVSSLIGGFAGAALGRRLSPVVLRTVIVLLGLVALWNMLF